MNKKIIANKLKILRGDISVEKIAGDLNISQSSIRMYESGKRIPRDEVKVLLARYYNTTVEKIFFDNNYTFSVLDKNPA